VKLSLGTIDRLAEMICGSHGTGGAYDWKDFPYRSSSHLTEFFRRCNLPYTHDGSTRKWWVSTVLEEINEKTAPEPSLPPPEMIAVIQQLVDPMEYAGTDLNHETAVAQLNKVLAKDGLQVTFVHSQAVIENLNTQVTSRDRTTGRLLSREETLRRQAFEEFLNNASEDEFTEEVLVRLFAQLGFERVTVSGHQDRQLEFGKDMWMRYRLPTQHQLYVGVQVKIGRIHASGSELTGNISGILAQLLMLMTYPVFDPETNSKHLFDHVFLVSSGEITKQARELLSEFLDNAMRRNVLFMDREDILDLCVRFGLPVPGAPEIDESGDTPEVDDLPF